MSITDTQPQQPRAGVHHCLQCKITLPEDCFLPLTDRAGAPRLTGHRGHPIDSVNTSSECTVSGITYLTFLSFLTFLPSPLSLPGVRSSWLSDGFPSLLSIPACFPSSAFPPISLLQSHLNLILSWWWFSEDPNQLPKVKP